jgi:XTP/dITP diphosphohydrolase
MISSPLRAKLLIASGNTGKLREIRSILSGIPIELVGLDQLGHDPNFAEDCDTFEEVARSKALHYHRLHGLPAVADDSGLVVDALGGEPGVRSSRYLGMDTPFSEKMAHILGRLQGLPAERREARFTCALALAAGGRVPVTIVKHVFGWIAEEPRGSGGFGYDPIFFCPQVGATFSEVTEESKNLVSHRGRALRAFLYLLETHADVRRSLTLPDLPA